MLAKLKLPLILIPAILLISNIVVLDILFFNQYKNVSKTQEQITSPIEDNQKPNNLNYSSYITQTPTISLTPTPTIKPISNTTQVSTKNQVKDFMISLGSGKSQSSDWTDVPGVGATINSNNYGSIKSTFFEVSITMPTANNLVSLRLYNVTDKHPVWYSQIDSNGQTTAFLSSQIIRLDPGEKFYQVQMKSLITDEPVSLVQSRIRITTN